MLIVFLGTVGSAWQKNLCNFKRHKIKFVVLVVSLYWYDRGIEGLSTNGEFVERSISPQPTSDLLQGGGVRSTFIETNGKRTNKVELFRGFRPANLCLVGSLTMPSAPQAQRIALGYWDWFDGLPLIRARANIKELDRTASWLQPKQKISHLCHRFWRNRIHIDALKGWEEGDAVFGGDLAEITKTFRIRLHMAYTDDSREMNLEKLGSEGRNARPSPATNKMLETPKIGQSRNGLKSEDMLEKLFAFSIQISNGGMLDLQGVWNPNVVELSDNLIEFGLYVLK